MIRQLILAALLALNLSQALAESIVGRLLKVEQGKYKLELPYTQELLKIRMEGQFEKHLDSFLGYDTYLRFEGKRIGNEFIAERTPAIISGPSRLTGILAVIGDEVFIGPQRVLFQAASKVNGFSFDALSIRSFDGREVIANGKFADGYFTVSAIVPAGLYAASVSGNSYTAKGIHSSFKADPFDYVLKTLPKNKYSQSEASFRGTLLGVTEQVKPSEHALIVTLSGRQGEDLGAANGHFAIGMARVGEDLALDMEVHNYYPPKNEKEIIPGFIDYVDYFGGVTSGQNNYRPTYTVVIYGEDRERLLRMRDSLDEEFAALRRGADNFSIAHNCTTVSVEGLNGIGVTGKHQRFFRKVFHPKNLFKLNPFYFFADRTKMAGQLSFSLGKNSSYYVPRPAFDSIVKNLKWLLRKERLQGHRIDFIFQAQTPSKRPVGGIAANGFFESLKLKLKEGKHEKRPFSQAEVSEILNKVR